MNIKELLFQNIKGIDDVQAEKFALYYEMLVDWNENRCNLTAITEPEEVVTKHFADSLLPMELIPPNVKVVDVGTGAGFPGVPLLIMRPDIDMTFIDSLGKRIEFLKELTNALGLKARIIHARAEDAGRDPQLREKFHIALSRAVAQTNVLLEWTSPLIKIGGKSLMYKGAAAQEELNWSVSALKALNLQAVLLNYNAPWGERNVIVARKSDHTPKAYPRKAGTAKKKPL